jgi:hypothetical protein
MKAIVATALILVGLFIALVIVVESCSGPDEASPPKYPANPGEVSPEASPGEAESTTAIQYGLPDTGGVQIWR